MIEEKIILEVIEIIKKAGKEVLKIYKGKDYELKNKEDNSPVTLADINSNDILIRGLSKYNYPILSEESIDDAGRLNAKKCWIVDPLDGTSDFINKTGEFSIMVALVNDKSPIFSVVYAPVTDKTYYAIKNQGCFLLEGSKPPKKLLIDKKANKDKIRMLISRFHKGDIEKNISQKKLISEVKEMGSIGVKIGAIVEGKADFYITLNPIKEWDACAPLLILEEAGGQVFDKNGNEIKFNNKNPKLENGFVGIGGLDKEFVLSKVLI